MSGDIDEGRMMIGGISRKTEAPVSIGVRIFPVKAFPPVSFEGGVNLSPCRNLERFAKVERRSDMGSFVAPGEIAERFSDLFLGMPASVHLEGKPLLQLLEG